MRPQSGNLAPALTLHLVERAAPYPLGAEQGEATESVENHLQEEVATKYNAARCVFWTGLRRQGRI